MSTDWEWITTTMQLRRSEDAALIARMIEVKNRYNNDIVVPMIDVEDEPSMRALMPQIIHDGIEGIAQRSAGSMPNISVPALRGSAQTSMMRAATTRRALFANLDHNVAPLLIRRGFRQLAGYGTFAMVVMPDFADCRASIELRDPLTAYPDLRAAEQMRPPINVGFIFGRSAAWIRQKYPEATDFINVVQGLVKQKNPRAPELLWDMVEWIDEDEIVVGVLGPRHMDDYAHGLTADDQRTVSAGMELRRWPNRAGMVPAAVPRRVTLDRIAGQMEQIIGHVDWMAKLMALEVTAAERDVFPDVAVLGEANAIPRLASGAWIDGRSGGVNLVEGARGVQVLHQPPGQQTMGVMQQLERGARMSSGASPLYGGDNPNSLRTGRAIDTVGSFSVDPMSAEVQEIMARCLARTILPAVIETEKGYWPSRSYCVFSGERGDTSMVEYTPDRDFEVSDVHVSYAFPGTDISQITVTLAQLVGGKMLSPTSARKVHPLIDNPEEEERLLVRDEIDQAMLAGMLQQAASGQLPMVDLARIQQLVTEGKTIADAVVTAQDEAQKRQAAQAPPPGPGEVTAPSAQPGLSMPGQGVEQPPIPPPPQGLKNFQRLAGALRQ